MKHIELNSLGLQATRFIGVGIISAIINYFFFYALLLFSPSNYLLSSAIGYLAGLLAGFFLNSRWTFKNKNLMKNNITHYLCLYVFSLLCGLFFLRILVQNFNVLPEIANIAILGLTTVSNFIGLKFWVFKIHHKNV
jgi:putative flippase GtrA